MVCVFVYSTGVKNNVPERYSSYLFYRGEEQISRVVCCYLFYSGEDFTNFSEWYVLFYRGEEHTVC